MLLLLLQIVQSPNPSGFACKLSINSEFLIASCISEREGGLLQLLLPLEQQLLLLQLLLLHGVSCKCRKSLSAQLSMSLLAVRLLLCVAS